VRVAAILLAGCWAASPPPVVEQQQPPAPIAQPPRAPRLEVYDLPFERVFAAASAAVYERFPSAVDDASQQTIKTAWQRLKDDDRRWFGRLDVQLDGPPWTIAITAHVAEWYPGDATPTVRTGKHDLARLDLYVGSIRRAIHAYLTR
jgi:hypothetical protein